MGVRINPLRILTHFAIMVFEDYLSKIARSPPASQEVFMLVNLFPDSLQGIATLIGLALSFFLTVIVTAALKKLLPRDQGRAYAVNGQLSEGKPRGAGILFVLVFCVVSALLAPMSLELGIYLVLIALSMLTGYLDDRSATPWKDYKKAVLDLILAVLAAVTYVFFNRVEGMNAIHVSLFFDDAVSFNMPMIPYAILAVILIWASVNVTNCSDGVDGLSGSVTIASLLSFFGIYYVKEQLAAAGLVSTTVDAGMPVLILFFVLCLLAYLWFNASPSKLLMGDAGSRAMGFFLALVALKSGSPFLFLPLALVLILDGGLGLIKVFLLRFFKIKILANTRTPIHDHVRKNKGWSDTQTVFRFTIVQLVIGLLIVAAGLLLL